LTLAFNITVNHRRRILLISPGLPGRWNDNTLQLSDDLFRGIEDGSILGVGSVDLCLFLSMNAITWTFNVRYQFIEFELFENGSNGPVAVLYRGVWLLVDNRYLEHSSLLPPRKITTIQAEMRLSKWDESMRKDVECTFGILKGRYVHARCVWRILKTGIQSHGVPVVTDIWCWKTCCALQNWSVLSCVSDYARFAQGAQKILAEVQARCGECVTCP